MDVWVSRQHVECSIEGYYGLLTCKLLSAIRAIKSGSLMVNVQVCWIATLLFLPSIALVKCVILLKWVNIFVPRGQTTYFTWVSYATCGAITALSPILFVMDLANCTPFEFNWNQLLPGGFCRFSVPRFALASAIANSILDLIPLILA
jgi:hypothetical protein